LELRAYRYFARSTVKGLVIGRPGFNSFVESDQKAYDHVLNAKVGGPT